MTLRRIVRWKNAEIGLIFLCWCANTLFIGIDVAEATGTNEKFHFEYHGKSADGTVVLFIPGEHQEKIFLNLANIRNSRVTFSTSFSDGTLIGNETFPSFSIPFATYTFPNSTFINENNTWALKIDAEITETGGNKTNVMVWIVNIAGKVTGELKPGEGGKRRLVAEFDQTLPPHFKAEYFWERKSDEKNLTGKEVYVTNDDAGDWTLSCKIQFKNDETGEAVSGTIEGDVVTVQVVTEAPTGPGKASTAVGATNSTITPSNKFGILSLVTIAYGIWSAIAIPLVLSIVWIIRIEYKANRKLRKGDKVILGLSIASLSVALVFGVALAFATYYEMAEQISTSSPTTPISLRDQSMQNDFVKKLDVATPTPVVIEKSDSRLFVTVVSLNILLYVTLLLIVVLFGNLRPVNWQRVDEYDVDDEHQLKHNKGAKFVKDGNEVKLGQYEIYGHVVKVDAPKIVVPEIVHAGKKNVEIARNVHHRRR